MIYSNSSFSSSYFGCLDYKVITIISDKPQKLDCKASFISKNISDIIEYSLRYTTNHLTFKLKSYDNMIVNKIDKYRVANCVGYTIYFNSVLSKILEQNNVKNYKISHARVSILFFGQNICNYFSDPSFQNHDISIVTNTITHEIYYVDPSLSETFGDIIIKK